MAIYFSNEPSIQLRASGVRLLNTSDIDNSGAHTHTITGIPSEATKVFIMFMNWSTDSGTSQRMKMRVGHGSGSNIDSGDNYDWATQYVDSNGTNAHYGHDESYWSILDESHTGGAHADSGLITITRMTHPSSAGNGGWLFTCQAGDTTRSLHYCSTGRWDATTGINTVQLFNSGNEGYDAGARLVVSFEMGDYY